MRVRGRVEPIVGTVEEGEESRRSTRERVDVLLSEVGGFLANGVLGQQRRGERVLRAYRRRRGINPFRVPEIIGFVCVSCVAWEVALGLSVTLKRFSKFSPPSGLSGPPEHRLWGLYMDLGS